MDYFWWVFFKALGLLWSGFTFFFGGMIGALAIAGLVFWYYRIKNLGGIKGTVAFAKSSGTFGSLVLVIGRITHIALKTGKVPSLDTSNLVYEKAVLPASSKQDRANRPKGGFLRCVKWGLIGVILGATGGSGYVWWYFVK